MQEDKSLRTQHTKKDIHRKKRVKTESFSDISWKLKEMTGLVAARDLRLEIILWNLKQLEAKLGKTVEAMQDITKSKDLWKPILTQQNYEKFTTSMDQATKEIQPLNSLIGPISLEEMEEKLSYYCGELNNIPFNTEHISLIGLEHSNLD